MTYSLVAGSGRWPVYLSTTLLSSRIQRQYRGSADGRRSALCRYLRSPRSIASESRLGTKKDAMLELRVKVCARGRVEGSRAQCRRDSRRAIVMRKPSALQAQHQQTCLYRNPRAVTHLNGSAGRLAHGLPQILWGQGAAQPVSWALWEHVSPNTGAPSGTRR